MLRIPRSGPMTGMRIRKTRRTLSVLAALAIVTAACAAVRAEDATRSALKGCLLASPAGLYQLTEDESGTVYNLVGDAEALGFLVGADVLVTGNRLAPNQVGVTPSHQGQGSSGASAVETSGSDPQVENSFRVASAVKFNDLCALSTTSKVNRQPDVGIETPRPDSDPVR